MARTNIAISRTPVGTHEGGAAARISPLAELKRSVLAALLWEDSFYATGSEHARRVEELCAVVNPHDVAALAIEARNRMKLRHVPLFLVRKIARLKHGGGVTPIGTIVADTLDAVIQRPDEITEFLSLYWREKRQPLSAGVKRGLARAFQKFGAYQLSKWNRDTAVKLRDVLFLVNPTPKNGEQAEAWKKLAEKTLESADTWEVSLSAGGGKKETFERLLRERKLGGIAVLMNLRNMQNSGVDEGLIRERLEAGIEKALPFRFCTAARYAPNLEPSLEKGMLQSVADIPVLPGKTGLLIDVSGSMDVVLSAKGEATRLDAAAGLAILVREKCEQGLIATFSYKVVEVPPRRGFALRDAVLNSQAHGGTRLGAAVTALKNHFAWRDVDRLVVITDEQSEDALPPAWAPKSYIVNVATYAHGVGYGDGWTHINGWSEHVLEYIREVEASA